MFAKSEHVRKRKNGHTVIYINVEGLTSIKREER